MTIIVGDYWYFWCFMGYCTAIIRVVPSRLRKNYAGTPERRWSVRVAQQKNISAGCSKRPFSKAAASKEARRTLRYVEPLSDARTPLADFFSILLEYDGSLHPLQRL